MKVLFNKILVNAPEAEKTTESGLIMHIDRSASAITSAEVAFVGEKTESSIKAGDIVFFPLRAGTSFKNGDTEYLVLDERDIIAIQ